MQLESKRLDIQVMTMDDDRAKSIINQVYSCGGIEDSPFLEETYREALETRVESMASQDTDDKSGRKERVENELLVLLEAYSQVMKSQSQALAMFDEPSRRGAVLDTYDVVGRTMSSVIIDRVLDHIDMTDDS
jgi:hypothetical protein